MNEFLSVTSYAANYSVRTAKPNLLLTMEGHIPKYVWMTGINAGLYCFLCFSYSLLLFVSTIALSFIKQ